MFSTLLDRLGNWNPQLLRELKGRLKPRNVIITTALSGVIQFIVFSFAWLALPGDATPEAIKRNSHPANAYCTGSLLDGYYPPIHQCELIPQTTRYAIDWQVWNQNLFFWLSLTMTFALLVIGSYLLIGNLDREQRRGTLNFIRLSPRSAVNILAGQLVGAPILVYLAIALALPLQLKAAFGAGIGTPELVGFFSLIGVIGLTIYSIALLFGLISFGLGGFQAWLASGLIFVLQMIALSIGINGSHLLTALNWLGLFSPLTSLRYLTPDLDRVNGIPYYFGPHSLDFSGFVLLVWINGLLVIGWAWHALCRKFHNPAIPLVRRRDSYLMTLCFQGMILPLSLSGYWSGEWVESAFTTVFALNLGFFLILLVALSPAWQALQDWSRCRQMSDFKSGRRGLLNDLVLGEKSPPLVAFALNVAIAAGCLALWIMLSPFRGKALALSGLLAFGGVLMVYAGLSQVIMLTRLKQRGIWATAAIIASVFLPLIVLSVFYEVPQIRVLVPITAPWFILLDDSPFGEPTLFTVLCQWGMTVLLTVFSTRQLHRLGKSASQRLFASSEMRSALPSPQ